MKEGWILIEMQQSCWRVAFEIQWTWKLTFDFSWSWDNIEVACSVWHCHIIFIFTQTIKQTIVSVCTSDFLAFFLFFFYYVVCKQVERFPLLVIKTMTLKSQTNIQINRQQDARWRKKIVRALLITLVSQLKHGGKRSENCFEWSARSGNKYSNSRKLNQLKETTHIHKEAKYGYAWIRNYAKMKRLI